MTLHNVLKEPCFLLLFCLSYTSSRYCDFFERLWRIIQLSRQTKSKYIYRGLICYFIRNLFILQIVKLWISKQQTHLIAVLCTRDLGSKCLNLNELLVPGVPDLGLLLGVGPGHVQLTPAAAEAHCQHLLAHGAPVTIGWRPG